MRVGYVDVRSNSGRFQRADWHLGSRHFQRGNFLFVGSDSFVALLQRDRQEQQHFVGHLEEEEEGKLQAHRFELTHDHARSLREPLTHF